MRYVMLTILLLAVILASCDASAATQEPEVIPGTPEPTSTPEELTAAETAALETLSANLEIPVEDIHVVSSEAVDWPDGCLGIVDAGLTCAEVITPGHRIVLEADGREVEYRTNEDGSHIRAATVAMTWRREGGFAGFCDHLTVYLSGEVHASSCIQGQYSEARLIDLLSEAELAQLNEWLNEHGTVKVDASDPRGVADRMLVVMTFMGTGDRQSLSRATEKEMLEFAQDLHFRVYK